MTINKKQAVKKMRLFNEKVIELENSEFIKHRKIKVEITTSGSKFTGPRYYEEIKAVLPSIRMLIDDKESFSICQMDQIHHSFNLDDSDRQYHHDLRDNLKEYMKKNAFMYNGLDISYKELLDIVMYGDAIHVKDEQKKIIFDAFMKNPWGVASFTSKLWEIIGIIIQTGIYIRQLNEKLINTLE